MKFESQDKNNATDIANEVVNELEGQLEQKLGKDNVYVDHDRMHDSAHTYIGIAMGVFDFEVKQMVEAKIDEIKKKVAETNQVFGGYGWEEGDPGFLGDDRSVKVFHFDITPYS